MKMPSYHPLAISLNSSINNGEPIMENTAQLIRENWKKPFLLDTAQKVDHANLYQTCGQPWRLYDHCPFNPADLAKRFKSALDKPAQSAV